MVPVLRFQLIIGLNKQFISQLDSVFPSCGWLSFAIGMADNLPMWLIIPDLVLEAKKLATPIDFCWNGLRQNVGAVEPAVGEYLAISRKITN